MTYPKQEPIKYEKIWTEPKRNACNQTWETKKANRKRCVENPTKTCQELGSEPYWESLVYPHEKKIAKNFFVPLASGVCVRIFSMRQHFLRQYFVDRRHIIYLTCRPFSPAKKLQCRENGERVRFYSEFIMITYLKSFKEIHY